LSIVIFIGAVISGGFGLRREARAAFPAKAMGGLDWTPPGSVSHYGFNSSVCPLLLRNLPF
jgi:hypothetical protein